MIISLVVVLIVAGIALTGYLYIQSSLKPVSPGSKEMKKVENSYWIFSLVYASNFREARDYQE